MPLPGELLVPSESIIPNARAFVRSLNVLLKYTRLYGLEHLRSAGQFEISWNELEQAVQAAGQPACCWGPQGHSFCWMACRWNRRKPSEVSPTCSPPQEWPASVSCRVSSARSSKIW